jgi:DNA-binding NtrC family response regulator
LRDAAEAAQFRKDLYYRIAGHEITLPPLRERVDDIPELAIYLGRQVIGEAPKFSNAALRLMLEHSWPGNLRELANAVQRALRKSDGGVVGVKDIDFLRRSAPPVRLTETAAQSAQPAISERDWIAEALARNGFRRAKTAEELGMTTRTLYNKIKKHGLQG